MSKGYVKSQKLGSGPPGPRSEDKITLGWKEGYDKPLVSILCVAYNHAPYIEDALNGFLMQETDFPFEIIVHDDASTDGTREIIQRYQLQYPNIIKTILQDENQYSKGRRPPGFFLDHIDGDYCAFCEGDDFWIDRNKLSKQLSIMKENPHLALCVHPAIIHDLRRNYRFKGFFKGKKSSVFDVNSVVVSRDQFAPTASYFVSRNELYAMPWWFFFAEDLPFGDYFIETIAGKSGVVYLPDPMSVYRFMSAGSYSQLSSQLSIDKLISRFESSLKYTKKLYSYREIDDHSVAVRCKVVCNDYLLKSASLDSFLLFSSVMKAFESEGLAVPLSSRFVNMGRFGFFLFRFYFLSVNFLKRLGRFLLREFKRVGRG